jgi:hypothetical protein
MKQRPAFIVGSYRRTVAKMVGAILNEFREVAGAINRFTVLSEEEKKAHCCAQFSPGMKGHRHPVPIKVATYPIDKQLQI